MEERISSFEELKAAREAARSHIDLRTGPKDMRVTVHMGTCGIAAGGREVLLALMEALGDAPAGHVSIQQAGCAGLCDQEPMISITDRSGEVFRYGRLDRDKIRRIAQQHVLRGKPLNEYLMNK